MKINAIFKRFLLINKDFTDSVSGRILSTIPEIYLLVYVGPLKVIPIVSEGKRLETAMEASKIRTSGN